MAKTWLNIKDFKYNPDKNYIIKFYDSYDENIEYKYIEAHEVNGDPTEWIQDVEANDKGGWGYDSIIGYIEYEESDFKPLSEATEEDKLATRFYLIKYYEVDYSDESSFDFLDWFENHGSDEPLPAEAYTECAGTEIEDYMPEESEKVRIEGFLDVYKSSPNQL